MLFSPVSLFSIFMFIYEVLATPSTRHRPHLARGRGSQLGQLNNRTVEFMAATSDKGFVYSVNWAGALWTNKPNGTFTSVTGTFVGPVLSGQSGSSLSVWVGIDGDSCQNGILQTGVEMTFSNGSVKYDAWSEWYPDPVDYFAGIDIFAGDVVKLTVIAISPTSGIAAVENLSNNQTIAKMLNSTAALCGQNAEWIVEDVQKDGSPVFFANFSTVTFTNAQAGGQNSIYTPSGSTVVNIRQNNHTMTNVWTNDSSVTVVYV